jgi:hypothetical protein
MREDLMISAQSVADLMGTRIQIAIPAILAEGETFEAKISVTGANALPLHPKGITLRFEGSTGIEGLPRKFMLTPDTSTHVISGLTASGPEAGLIRVQVEDGQHHVPGANLASNPAWVFKTPPYRIFFGDLHVHTEYSNCSSWRCLSPEWCYEYARDISLLDFVAPADHLRGIAVNPQRWAHLQAAAGKHNIEGKFVTFLAFESSHAQGYGGDNNAYFLDDDAPYFWLDREDMRGIAPSVHLRELWRFLESTGKPFFTVPHHTGRAEKYRAWNEDYHDPEREPLFEIYSSWGSSEMRHTRLPISGGNNDAPSYFVDALKAGARFGVIASSDDHATLPGSVHHFRTGPYNIPMLNGYSHKGLAAIRAPELTRAALFTAMCQRQTYASTHARSLVDVRIGDAGMGTACLADSSLRKRRTIDVRLSLDGSSHARVTLMRNGEFLAVKTVKCTAATNIVNTVVFQDDEPLESIAVRESSFHSLPFAVYYVRVEDSNGAHQWTSPIWIDLS